MCRCWQAVPGPWLFPQGEATNLAPEELALELLREKLFRRLNKELPYRLHIRLQRYAVKPDGSLRIATTLKVPNATVKKIVVGAKGHVSFAKLGPRNSNACTRTGQVVI